MDARNSFLTRSAHFAPSSGRGGLHVRQRKSSAGKVIRERVLRPQRLKPAPKTSHLSQRLKRCATQNQMHPN